VTDDHTTPGAGPIRTAVVGYGTGGRVFHAPLISSDGRYTLAAIVTASPQRRARAAADHPGAALLDDVDALLARAGEFDLVVISSPPDTHYAAAQAALEAGLDVVVDKPFVVRAEEGRRLVAYAAERQRRLTVFQNRRFDGDFLTVQRLVREGQLGRVYRFDSRFEWYKPDEPKVWKGHTGPDQGGGILYDLGPHLIDQARQLFGPVAHCYAELARYRGGDGADDEAFLALQHEDGVRSHLWMSSLAPLARPRFVLLGSAGSFTKSGLDIQESQLDAGLSPQDPAYGQEPEERWGRFGVGEQTTLVPTARGTQDAFYSQLAAAILGDGPLPVDPADALAGIDLIETVYAQTPILRR
jgi:scyllo-inositol 2-dehydrogenase (NADP+)